MTAFIPKNILVTGAAGFIGSNFMWFLSTQYPEVTAVGFDKLTYVSNKDNLPKRNNHFFVQGDICDSQLVDLVLKQYHINAIVHFAAESHVDRSIINPEIFIQANVLGTSILLDSVKRYWLNYKNYDSTQCRFHHVSTDEVFGSLDAKGSAASEDSPYYPSSPYSASKAASDHLVRVYYKTYGVPVTVSHCSNNYGPYQYREKLIPMVIQNCMDYELIPVYGSGLNVRDWLFVKDHCIAIDLILRRGITGESYNVGGNCEQDNLTVIRNICKLMDEKYPMNRKHENLITFVKDRPGHDWRYSISSSKIRKTLQWNPTYTFQKGLRETINSSFDAYCEMLRM